MAARITARGVPTWWYAVPSPKKPRALIRLSQLDKPNDGTTETKWANINGGNNMGTKTDWCHTTGMTYPGQCADPARNSVLNQNAAR